MRTNNIPTYNFINKRTKKIHEEFMSIPEMEAYLVANPGLDVIGTGNIISGIDGIRKPDNGFRDMIKEMKKKHKKGNFGNYNP